MTQTRKRVKHLTSVEERLEGRFREAAEEQPPGSTPASCLFAGRDKPK